MHFFFGVVNLTFKWSELARIDGFSLFLHKLLLIYGKKKKKSTLKDDFTVMVKQRQGESELVL